MKTYVDDATQNSIDANITQDGSTRHLSTSSNPNLPVGTILLEKDNPDSPRIQVTAASTQSAGGLWLTPVEVLMQEFCVKYSFITFTHSTIAGSLNQEAATKTEAISKAREWLALVYQPVEIDYVTV